MDLLAPDREKLLVRWSSIVAPFLEAPGWDTLLELAWLAEAGAQCDTIAEIGAYRGQSTRAILAGQRARVTCVDDFRAGSRVQFLAALEGALVSGNARLIEADSETASRIVEGPFDLVFIDGDHRREDVLADLLAWEPLVKPGGIVSGHDAHPHDPANGICAALAEHGAPYSILVDSIWAYRRAAA